MLFASPVRAGSEPPAGPADRVTLDQSTDPLPDFLPVPDSRQSTSYSCGAAALRSVLGYYGIQVDEEELMAKLATSPQEGTRPEAILRVAREYGLEAELRQGVTLEELEREVTAGRPTIVDAQAWREGEELKLPWTEVWESGHYMVAIGMDKGNVYFEDPSLEWSMGKIPRQELMDRWHDYENGPNGERQVYRQAAIFFRGKKPSPPPVVIPID